MNALVQEDLQKSIMVDFPKRNISDLDVELYGMKLYSRK